MENVLEKLKKFEEFQYAEETWIVIAIGVTSDQADSDVHNCSPLHAQKVKDENGTYWVVRKVAKNSGTLSVRTGENT